MAFAYMRGHFAFKYILTLNTDIHKQLLRKMITATVKFFDETPIGTILNRFSTNMGYLDKDFWKNIFVFVNGLLQTSNFMGYLIIANA